MKRVPFQKELKGEGSYNVVIQLSKKRAIRVGRLMNDNFELLTAYKRSTGIIHLLNETKPNPFGPSLIPEDQPGTIINFKDLDKDIQDLVKVSKMWREGNLTNKDNVFVQEMEFFSGGTPADGGLQFDEDLEILLFSLLWFVYTGGALYGLRHHDIKSGNILYKITDTDEIYTFTIHTMGTFQFTTNRIPVLIDYDFSSIFVTNQRLRNAVGTLVFAPPEVIIQHCEYYMFGLDSVFEDCPTYDYYSIAMTCIEHSIGLTLFDSEFEKLVNERDQFVNLAFLSLKSRHPQRTPNTTKQVRDNLDTLFYAFFVLDHFLDTIQDYNRLPHQIMKLYYDVYKTNQNFKDKIQVAKMMYPTLAQCETLLRLEPENRLNVNKPYEMFEPFFKKNNGGNCTNHLFRFEKLPIFNYTSVTSDDVQSFRVNQIDAMNKALSAYHSIASDITCQTCGKDANYIDSGSGLFYCDQSCRTT